MKIGFTLPASYAIGNPYSGIREQARYQVNALRKLGYRVICLDSWKHDDRTELDVVHVMTGGPAFHGIEQVMRRGRSRFVFAPIVDSRTPPWLYKLAASLGARIPRIDTIPGCYQVQARAADVTIARSQFERDFLYRALGIDRARIGVVLNGAPIPEDTDCSVLDRFSLPDEFALHISRVSNANKNVISLVEAFDGLELPIVCAGTTDGSAYGKKVLDKIREAKNAIWIGEVSHHEKLALYAKTILFCLPSQFEGTGLVALEAASYGCGVVITSNGGPPDYFGDFASYTTLGTPEEVRHAVRVALGWQNGDALQEHALRMTWESSARSLAGIYRSLNA